MFIEYLHTVFQYTYPLCDPVKQIDFLKHPLESKENSEWTRTKL